MSKSIIFDTETTGLNKEDKIIQIGAIIIDNDSKKVVDIYNDLFSCDVSINIDAMATHGIRESYIKDKEKFDNSKFLKTINNLNNKENYLIAHNLDFDLSMINKYNFQNNFQLIDTLQCAKHIYEVGEEINGYQISNYKLQSFRYILLSEEEEKEEALKYNLEIKAHDAIGDVIILKLFLRKLIGKLCIKYDIKSYNKVMDKLVELTKAPAEIKTIGFGKHKGSLLLDVAKKDVSYLRWLLSEQEKSKQNNDINFDKNLHWSLERLLS
jgi:DNA polymerase-3 subunit epsilon/exodeoxyribonuclease X